MLYQSCTFQTHLVSVWFVQAKHSEACWFFTGVSAANSFPCCALDADSQALHPEEET